MSESLINKHDELAKKFLTDIATAREFLQIHIPNEIKAKCDFESLTIEAGSYIDDDLRKRFSDIVYKLDLLDKSSCVYVHVLIEHQSTAEKLMPVRILKYELELLHLHINKYGEEAKLPIIVPLVFYNGDKSPYPHKTNIRELFADVELAEKFPLGNFKLIDLTVIPNEEILQHGKIALLEMLAKHIRVRDFKSVVQLLLKAVINAHSNHLSKSLFDSAITYLINAREGKELEPLFHEIIANVSEYRETIMTYAEELRQEGEQKAQKEIAQELLKSGVDSRVIATATHLTAAQIDELKKSLH